MKLTNTERLQMYKPCDYSYVVIHMNSSLNYEIVSHDLYRGADALERFVTKIEEELLIIQEELSAPAEIIMAPGNLKAYNEATKSLQKFEEVKHRLLEVIKWEASMGEDIQKRKRYKKNTDKL
ncbi:197_t:CDS:2 [Funneliformis geosporum]|uniref:197_t:CDS:1 n=1 Tax=Funneliformis geosporum TaxID=1117311 RepID=A0A9W4T6P8_9GLOM|nr:197_t:CDS:2 [Funneliformis geosporum]